MNYFEFCTKLAPYLVATLGMAALAILTGLMVAWVFTCWEMVIRKF